MGVSLCGEMAGDWMATRFVAVFCGVLVIELVGVVARIPVVFGVAGFRRVLWEALTGSGVPSVLAMGIFELSCTCE